MGHLWVSSKERSVGQNPRKWCSVDGTSRVSVPRDGKRPETERVSEGRCQQLACWVGQSRVGALESKVPSVVCEVPSVVCVSVMVTVMKEVTSGSAARTEKGSEHQ